MVLLIISFCLNSNFSDVLYRLESVHDTKVKAFGQMLVLFYFSFFFLRKGSGTERNNCSWTKFRSRDRFAARLAEIDASLSVGTVTWHNRSIFE